MATTDTTAETLASYRLARFEELGFSTENAARLSEATMTVCYVDRYDQPRTLERSLDWHQVRRLLDAGATHDQILAIYL